jgi:hypothetical protein
MAKYSNEDFIAAVACSRSVAQVLQTLGLKAAGGNYATVRNKISSLGLDTTHFAGQAWSKGESFGPKRPLEDYLNNKFGISSHRLKTRLIKEGYFEYKCYSCNNSEWLGKPIALELEHINGKHSDNSLGNLTLLCPNCHALTDTYRGKNIGKAV